LCSNLRLQDMKDQLRKRMFTKRIVRRITLSIANGLSIELNTYALIRPTLPGTITPNFSAALCYRGFCIISLSSHKAVYEIFFVLLFPRGNYVAWFCHQSSFEGNNRLSCFILFIGLMLTFIYIAHILCNVSELCLFEISSHDHFVLHFPASGLFLMAWCISCSILFPSLWF
jgi:hypothetical protein